MSEEVKLVKVRANLEPGKFGYSNNQRYRDGDIFFMREYLYAPVSKKTKKPLLNADGSQRFCSWVELVDGYALNEESGKVEPKVKKLAKKE